MTIKRWQKAFHAHPSVIFYAVKANAHPKLLKLIFRSGAGADVVSGGELDRCMRLGLTPSRIVFSGVGKTDEEIEKAIRLKIHAIQLESIHEFERVAYFAKILKKVARVSFRINPDINVKTNPYIATGLYETKFGIDEKTALKLAHSVLKCPEIRLVGLSCHLGSQIQSLVPFKKAAARMVALSETLKRQGAPLEFIDMGGGLGISYQGEKTPQVEVYAKTLIKEIKKTGLRIHLEPGRSLVGPHGILVTTVIRTKKTPKKNFVIVDAAMNDLIRPALYGAYHEISVIKPRKGRLVKYDVVGPVCETGDFLGLNRMLPKDLKPGDKLLIHDVGAYGMSMASNYNLREKATEIVV